MAQTKKRATPKRAKSSTKSRAPKPASARSQSKGTGRSKPTSQRSRSSNGSSGGGARVDAVRHAVDTVEDKAKNAGQTVGKAASKAKIPLVAGGAAIAGAAGGIALSSRQGRKNGIGSALRMAPLRKPRIKIDSRDVARAAKEVGNFSAQVGELASELQRARESADNAKHRSPVEVVLQGLTARR